MDKKQVSGAFMALAVTIVGGIIVVNYERQILPRISMLNGTTEARTPAEREVEAVVATGGKDLLRVRVLNPHLNTEGDIDLRLAVSAASDRVRPYLSPAERAWLLGANDDFIAVRDNQLLCAQDLEDARQEPLREQLSGYVSLDTERVIPVVLDCRTPVGHGGLYLRFEIATEYEGGMSVDSYNAYIDELR